jgi:trimeric autotransporter adhesin
MRTTAFVLLASSFFSLNARSQPYIISTLAGTNRLLNGGLATAAPLRSPISVALDASGNLYIADENDNRIRKVNPAGIISTYAGTGIPGYSGDRGQAASAALNFPTGIALDSAGNMYVADEGNNVVRRIAVDGTINTIAGNGKSGYAGDNGEATSAQIDPVAVALDSQGNLYIADGFNYRIRKVDTSGIITTIAGNGIEGGQGDNGPALSAEIDFVTDLAVDNVGNLYLADLFNYEVRKIDTSGMMTDFAGGLQNLFYSDSMPANTVFLVPDGVAFDGSGNLYISDEDTINTAVRRVDLSTGLISTVAGTGQDGFTGDGGEALAAELNYPTGLAVSGGALYFADVVNQRVRKVLNNIITTVAGTGIRDNGPATNAFLNFPEGLAIDGSGDILVADTGNTEAREFKAGGNINSVGQLLGGTPYGVTADKAGNFYLTDEEPSFPYEMPHILKLTPGGTTSVIAGNGPDGYSGDDGPATLAVLNSPQGLAVDAAGNIYVADYGNHRVRKIDTTGNINTIGGNGKIQFSGDDGPATSAGMDPIDLAVDSAGNVLVVDQLNNRVRMIAPNDTITTVVGTGMAGHTGDGGPAAAALLNLPSGIALDSSGNMYIADEGNSAVRRVTAGGLITTIAGNGTLTPSAGDGGPATAAQLNPFSVAVDAAGNVYVTDYFNDHVRLLTPQLVKAASMTIVSGSGQSAMVDAGLPAPLVLKVTDGTGAAVPGVLVTFTVSPEGAATVTPSPALTLNDGTVTAIVTLGSNPGAVTITAQSAGLPNVSFSLSALASNSPSISAGGVTSAGLSNPPVNVLSPNAIVSIFGSNFAPAGTASQAGLVNGQLPTNVAGVCVEFATVQAPIFAVYPGQINVQVPAVTPGNVPVQVITNCGSPQAIASPPVSVAAQATAPEFFYFTTTSSGANPIAAVNGVTGGYVGASGLISGATFTPAAPGQYLTLFATGFGATNPSFAPGVLPSGIAKVTAPVSITFGGVTLAPADILYVGLSQFAGLYQVDIQVPANVPDGNQPLVITVGGVASPSAAFITVQNGQ